MLGAAAGLMPNMKRSLPGLNGLGISLVQAGAANPAFGDAAAAGDPAHSPFEHRVSWWVYVRVPERVTPLSPAQPPCPSAPRPGIGLRILRTTTE
ncbi:hypothetical protein FHETE_3368 [Fusarium heterosporum]|uniref:Uncharacterized protein n=1 Tax=Fusarium heterosporum TaxID=42747 RepID=A0A8H5TQQ2_FUSHE|nr:hypothetical protein FHETE_3368 [Fusarium heterosporum]